MPLEQSHVQSLDAPLKHARDLHASLNSLETCLRLAARSPEHLTQALTSLDAAPSLASLRTLKACLRHAEQQTLARSLLRRKRTPFDNASSQRPRWQQRNDPFARLRDTIRKAS